MHADSSTNTIHTYNIIIAHCSTTHDTYYYYISWRTAIIGWWLVRIGYCNNIYEEEVDIEQEQTEDKADNNSQRDGDVPTINNNLKEAEQQQHLKSI